MYKKLKFFYTDSYTDSPTNTLKSLVLTIFLSFSSPQSIASVSSCHSSNSTRRLLQLSFLSFFLLSLVNSMGTTRYSSNPNESTSLFFIIDIARPFRRRNSLVVKFRRDVFVSLPTSRVYPSATIKCASYYLQEHLSQSPPAIFHRRFHKMLAVNRQNRESCPWGKGTTPTKRRSVEGRKRTWGVATVGRPENRVVHVGKY